SGDLTVIWPLQIAPNLTRRTPFVVELRNIPFRNQEQVLFYIADRLPRFTAAFEDGTIEIPKDADVLADHRAIVLEQGVAKVSERRAGSDGQGRHGDSAMAAALAFFASRVDAGSIAYFPARVSGKREGFEAPIDYFGAPPMDKESAGDRVRGY